MTKRLTAFEMLLGELQLSCGLTPRQAGQMRAVFGSWGAQRLSLPPQREHRNATARKLARTLLDAGEDVPRVRDRLIALGVPQSTAYLMISEYWERSSAGQNAGR